MRKFIFVLLIACLLSIESTFCKMEYFFQAGGFGLFPMKTNPYSKLGSDDILKNAYGLSLRGGGFTLYGHFGSNFNILIGEASVNSKSNSIKINKINDKGLNFQFQYEAQYTLFERKYLTPYIGLGVGFSMFDVKYSYFDKIYDNIKIINSDEYPLTIINLNLSVGMYIPINKHFDGYIHLQTPLLPWNPASYVPENEKPVPFNYLIIGAGISYKLKYD